MTQNTILIGIGNAGCKILAKAETELKKLYINTAPEVIEKYSGGVNTNQQEKALSAKNSSVLRIGEKVCGKFSALGDTELAEKAVEESKKEILKQIEDYDKIVILTSLGGGTSNGATKKLAEICVELEKEVIVVCGLPFDFEGRRFVLAQQAKIRLEKLCDVKSVQLNDKNIKKKYISVAEVFNIWDGIILQLLDTVIKE